MKLINVVLLSFAGTLFSVGVFSHLLKFDDAIIGVISCTSKILAGFMYAFATKTWQIYIGKYRFDKKHKLNTLFYKYMSITYTNLNNSPGFKACFL